MKKIVIFLILVCSALLFNGCADITYSVSVNKDGKICQEITVKPNYSLLSENGFSKETVNERVVTIFNEVKQNQQTEFKNHITPFVSNEQKENILSRVNGTYEFDDDKIILKMQFESYSDYIYYYCMEDKTASNEEKITKTPFTYKVESETDNMFCALKDSSLVTFIKTKFKEANENFNFEYDDLTYHYVYLTSDNKQRTNADETFYCGGLYSHKWNFDKTNLDKKIHFYKYSHIITPSWYYVALGFSAILFIVLVLLSGTINKKGVKNEQS